MKHVKKIFILCIVVIAIIATNAYAATGTVTTNGVRIRQEPSTDGTIITSLMESAQVEVLEEVNGWYKIIYREGSKSIEGYMKNDYIKIKNGEVVSSNKSQSTTETTPQETTTPIENNQQQANVPTQNYLGEKKLAIDVKLYTTPSITSSIKSVISKKTVVKVIEIAGNYAYVSTNGQTGWIRKENIETTNSEQQSNEKTGHVSVGEAIVRQKATTSSDMVTSLKRDTEVTIIGEEGNFYKITINGTEGYMAKTLITID